MTIPSHMPADSCEAEVRAWLDAAGQLNGREIVGLSSLSERATAMLVQLSDGASLFVKKPRPQHSEHVLHALSTGLGAERLREFLPEVLHHDNVSDVTVSVGLSASRTLRETWLAHRSDTLELLRRAADGLVMLHESSSASRLVASTAQRLHAGIPVPSYARLSPSDLARASGVGFPTFLARVQPIDHALHALRARWRPECLIHGDFKDDNIMVEGPIVRFVDWEMAGLGDPLWDVGCLVGQLVYHWVASIVPGGTRDFAAWVRDAAVPFAVVRAAVAAFVSRYVALRPPTEPETQRLHAIVSYAGVFLIHRTLATLEVTGHLTGPASNCLQVACTLVGAPERARDLIVGNLS